MTYRPRTSLWLAFPHSSSAKHRIQHWTKRPLRSPCQQDQASTAWSLSYGSQLLIQSFQTISYIAFHFSANTSVHHQYPRVMPKMKQTTTGLIGGRVWLRRSRLLSIANDCCRSSRRCIDFPRRWGLTTPPFADSTDVLRSSDARAYLARTAVMQADVSD